MPELLPTNLDSSEEARTSIPVIVNIIGKPPANPVSYKQHKTFLAPELTPAADG